MASLVNVYTSEANQAPRRPPKAGGAPGVIDQWKQPMGKVHICSTIEIPTYERLAAFARDRGLVHPTRGEVNTSDAVRQILDLALGDHEPTGESEGENGNPIEP